MKKQTSIEWLVSEIQRHIDAGYEFNPKYNEQLIDQAKQMHKQEIIEAREKAPNLEAKYKGEAEDYYNYTYEKEN